MARKTAKRSTPMDRTIKQHEAAFIRKIVAFESAVLQHQGLQEKEPVPHGANYHDVLDRAEKIQALIRIGRALSRLRTTIAMEPERPEGDEQPDLPYDGV